MTVRLARPEDASVLGPLHVRSWQEAYAHIIPEPFLEKLDPVARSERFAEIIADESVTMLVEEDGGDIAGFCSFGSAREVEGWGEVYAIYLRAESWGRGLGQALLAEAQSQLEGRFDQAMLWVLTRNTRARAFYERNGWRANGVAQYLEIAGNSIEELRYDRDLITQARSSG